jgi:hypothetical protein
MYRTWWPFDLSISTMMLSIFSSAMKFTNAETDGDK